MTFIILILVIVLISLTVIVYRRIYSIVLAILFILAITSGTLLLGMTSFRDSGVVDFFHIIINPIEFYSFIIVWYSMDLLCCVIIVRNYIRYRSVNEEYFKMKADRVKKNI